MKTKRNLGTEFNVNAVKCVIANKYVNFDKILAAKIKETYSYEGKLSDARIYLQKIQIELQAIKQKKWASRYTLDSLIFAKETRANVLSDRRRSKARIVTNTGNFEKKMQNMYLPGIYKQFTFGTWDAQKRDFKISDTTFATVSWSVESDWNYYAKSYGKPKNTISDRCVIFSTFDYETGKCNEVRHSLENFQGNFLEKAITSYLKAKPTKVSQHLLPIQLNEFFSLKLLKQVGSVQVYQRLIEACIYDYCVFDGTNTYHAISIQSAFKGLKTKREKLLKDKVAHFEKENTRYTFDSVHKEFGFCYDGVFEFCAVNNLDINESYSFADIRNSVVKKRQENCKLFKADLASFGIKLNCK